MAQDDIDRILTLTDHERFLTLCYLAGYAPQKLRDALTHTEEVRHAAARTRAHTTA